MRMVIAGASGFLGSHLTSELRGRGHEVTKLTRRRTSDADASTWDPGNGTLDHDLVAAADVVVNLAGSALSGNPHSRRWTREFRESRVTSTRVLAEAIAAVGGRPAFLAGNGINWYGDHGDHVVTEATDSRGHALPTEVTREWQAATLPAAEAGARVCVLRTAPVMDRRSEPLRALRLLFKAGLGSRLGDGGQYMPMISLRDWVGAVAHLAELEGAEGPFNVCCPITPTNAEFTRALARAVRRPALLAVPATVLRVGAGPVAPAVLGSLNVRPAALEQSGFHFRDPDVEAVLAAGLG